MIQNIDASKCTGCGICVEACPLDTLRLDPFTNKFPPCRQTCPAGVDIRGFIYYLKLDMLEEAARLIDQSLPYPAITGRLCTHPCEKACARKKVDEPINIRGLERYVGDYLIEQKLERFPVRHASKIAVIGSGPVGMAVANDLCRMGYVVTVFEKQAHIGGSFLAEVTEGRLDGEILEAEIDRLKNMGVVFSANTFFSKDLGPRELKEMRFKAVFLASGTETGFSSEPAIGQNDAAAIDPDPKQATTPGIFSEEDLFAKKMPLIKTIAAAKKAAARIDRYLQSRTPKAGRKAKRVRNFPKDGIRSKPRIEDEKCFDEDAAREEALRCMSCGSLAYIAYPEDCMTCYDCEVQCPVGAIKVHPFKEVLPLSLALNE